MAQLVQRVKRVAHFDMDLFDGAFIRVDEDAS
jgi:hypothetical protein